MASRKDEAVVRVAALAYWRAEDARVLVEGWRRSGLRLSAFARRHGIQPKRLARWVRRLKREDPVGFHRVRLVRRDRVVERAAEPIEIVLDSGRTVRVPSGFATEDLERVLAVLAAGA
ncbi:MAG: IS66 family insertion sequence element accessory protein TnpA [Longimicrobiales bacterium]